VLIPSPDVRTYDMKPEMSSVEVGSAVLKAMDDDQLHNFLCKKPISSNLLHLYTYLNLCIYYY
ncbi:MAG: hypothetical protein PF444_02105, partial [Bacteroidales bacterium]|nr:hypothetical protein [Bacteroidales bacterium]